MGPVSLARERVLPVLGPLDAVLPGGLVRGTTVEVSGPGATSLALALAAGPVRAGSWAVAVGWPELGWGAARALGLPLERVAVVVDPPVEHRADVLAALVGAFDLLLVPGRLLGGSLARRLSARLRERGSVLIRGGAAHVGGTGAGGTGADVRCRVAPQGWEGLGTGWGHLRARRVTVTVDGRAGAGGRRGVDLWLPGPDGDVALVAATEADATPARGPRSVRLRVVPSEPGDG